MEYTKNYIGCQLKESVESKRTKKSKRRWKINTKNQNEILKGSLEKGNIWIANVEQVSNDNWTISYQEAIPTNMNDNILKYYLRFNGSETAGSDEMS